MSTTPRLALFGALLVLSALVGGSVTSAADLTLVVCAPGYPGSTVEAQPAMDGLAAAVADAAGWDRGGLAATYFETEEGGVARLAGDDAGLALVTLPFFLEHRSALDLKPVMLAVPSGHEPLESWALVVGAGSVTGPADLAGWQLVSLAGHSPRFVRGPALGDWGELPASVSIGFSGAVLSSLRKAAKGEQVAVLLDAEQAAAIDRLPFAEDLEVVHRSPPLPVSVLCAVDDRIPAVRLNTAVRAFASLDERGQAAEALAGVRIDRFDPLDPASLEPAQQSFAGADD